MAAQILSVERVRNLLDYEPETGNLTWRYARSGISPGIAGSVGGPGYLYVVADGHRLLAHRLIWFHVHGKWPQGDIDHINHDRLDNRLANLRDVSRCMNNENRKQARCDNRIGVLGVSWHDHSKKWRARIMTGGKEYRLGLFDTTEDAHNAYLIAKRRLHEGCTI